MLLVAVFVPVTMALYWKEGLFCSGLGFHYLWRGSLVVLFDVWICVDGLDWR